MSFLPYASIPKHRKPTYLQIVAAFLITNNEERGSGNVLLLGNRLLRGAGVLQEGAATSGTTLPLCTETSHRRKSLATQIVPGSGTDQEAVRGLTMTTTQLSSIRSTLRGESNTSTVAKLLPCYYLLKNIYVFTKMRLDSKPIR
jgi:hypothetical protein